MVITRPRGERGEMCVYSGAAKAKRGSAEDVTTRWSWYRSGEWWKKAWVMRFGGWVVGWLVDGLQSKGSKVNGCKPANQQAST